MNHVTARQAQQNAAFLEALARTANARLAARTLGVHRATYLKRRARNPAFAAQWAEALNAAQLTLAQPAPQPAVRLKTIAGEPVVTRTRSGRLQLRRAAPGRITPAAEQAFLAALAASANIRFAAATAGFAHSSFYARARRDAAFAEAMKQALEEGTLRLEWAAMASAFAGLGLAAGPEAEGPSWHDQACDTPIPPMTPDQALQLLAYRHKARTSGRAGGRPGKLPDVEWVRDQVVRRCEAIKAHRSRS